MVKEDVELRYGKFIGIHEEWYKKWGFRYDPEKFYQYLTIELSNFDVKNLKLLFWLNTIARKSYRESIYQNDNFDLFYNHDPEKGPLKYIKIII